MKSSSASSAALWSTDAAPALFVVMFSLLISELFFLGGGALVARVVVGESCGRGSALGRFALANLRVLALFLFFGPPSSLLLLSKVLVLRNGEVLSKQQKGIYRRRQQQIEYFRWSHLLRPLLFSSEDSCACLLLRGQVRELLAFRSVERVHDRVVLLDVDLAHLRLVVEAHGPRLHLLRFLEIAPLRVNDHHTFLWRWDGVG